MPGTWSLAAGSARQLRTVLVVLTLALTLRPAAASFSGVSGLNVSLVDGCVEATVSAVAASYHADQTVQVEDIQSILLSIYLPCMNYANERKELVVVWPSEDDNLDTYETYANLYMARVPVVIKVVPVPMAAMAQRVLDELANGNTEHNLTVFASNPSHLGDMTEAGAIYSLLSFLKTDSTYNWGGVMKLFKDQMASYSMAPVGMPLTGPLLHFYYRKDLFESYKLAVPETWEQLAELAQSVRHSGGESGSEWEHALCSDYVTGCRLQEGFLAILASYVQTLGSDQGYIISAQTLESFLDTPAAAAALDIMALLRGSHSVTQNCTEMEQLFAQGKCLMAISDGTLFKQAHLADMLGQVGIVPLPGTAKVYVPATGSFMPCNSSLCPFGYNSSTAGLVNRVPYSPSRNNTMMHIFSGATSGSQSAGYSWFASISGPETSTYFVTSPQIPLEPFRDIHLQELSWAPFNYESAALQQYLSSVQTSGASVNGAIGPRFPMATDVLDMVNSTVARFLQGVLSNGDARASMEAELHKILYSGHNLTIDAMYRRSLNWINHTLPGDGSGGDSRHGHNGLEPRILVPAVVVPTLVLMFLVAATLLFMFHSKRDPRRNLLGRVIPPPISANTTVIVAELQDVTALWEHLPRETMQAAIQMHSKLLMQLLHKHCGYLSVREEYTDVLVFHNCKDALLFCIELQESLLHLNWPEELLQHDLCRPAWMKYLDNAAEAAPFLDAKNKKEEEEDEGTGKIPAGIAAEEDAPADAEHVAISISSNNLGATAANVGAAIATSYTFRTACKQMWQAVQETDAGAVLITRGFRVRCGMHTGMDDNDQITTGFDGRAHFKGAAVSLARAICAVTHGGLSIVSEASYRQLPMEDLWEKVMVLHGGEHELTDIVGCVNLYMVVNRHLRGRIASLPPILSERQISLSVTEAPLGRITIVFMNIVGMQTLQSWNADVAQQAVQMFHHTAGGLLQRFNGYQVEATDSLLLASFYYPAEAILWCLETQRRLLKLYWPKELLGHELGEEVVVSMPADGGHMVDRVVLRGLRIKAGIDLSDAKGSVHAITGRITYRGKMMNRAARIGVTATTGQILCSEGVWTQANQRDAPRMKQIDTVSLGLFSLKGVAEKMQVYQIRYDLAKDVNARRFSDPLNIHSEAELELHLPSSRRSSRYRAAGGSSRSLNGGASLTNIPATGPPDTPGSASLIRRSRSRRYSYLSQNLEGVDNIEMADLTTAGSTHGSRTQLAMPAPATWSGGPPAGLGELPLRDRRASRRAMERLSQLMSPADLDLFLAKLNEASASPHGGRPGEPE